MCHTTLTSYHAWIQPLSPDLLLSLQRHLIDLVHRLLLAEPKVAVHVKRVNSASDGHGKLVGQNVALVPKRDLSRGAAELQDTGVLDT